MDGYLRIKFSFIKIDFTMIYKTIYIARKNLKRFYYWNFNYSWEFSSVCSCSSEGSFSAMALAILITRFSEGFSF